MPSSFWDSVNGVIKESDIILEVLDARRIDETRNVEIEEKARRAGKVLIYVFNKCDLADVDSLNYKKKELFPSVFISSTKYHGIKMLYERIMIEAKRLGLKRPRVGVLGYPNGASKARTSSESGFTHGKQYVNAKNIVLIDTPGVIPYDEKDEMKSALTGMNTKFKDPETAVLKVMEEYPGTVEEFYGAEADDDKEVSLENIARKLNLVIRGGKPDTKRAAERVLRDIRNGDISI
jgi:ribosome biogenesis GTPase A